MEIRFVSSLDAEEEERIASALLLALGKILDSSSLRYVVRIKTTDQRIFEKTHPALALPTTPQ